MDKLKALEYFIRSVEAGSFSRAAQRLEISVPAVQKLVGALEHQLGVILLERDTHGVRPTPAGAEYLDRCRALQLEYDELRQVERRLKGSSERASGLLAVAVHPQLAHHVLLPALPRFHALHPEIEIDLRTVHRISDTDAVTADVLLLHGWPDAPPDYVHHRLGGARSLIAAAPEHWAAHGVPQHPSDLTRYACLPMRNPSGTLIDLWEFRRQDQAVQVPVRGWLSSNAREVVLDMVLGGHGVGRFTEMTTRNAVQSGRLVPVLLDWEVQNGPPVNLLFKGTARRTPRVRAFVDFVLQCVRSMQTLRDAPAAQAPTQRPAWHLRGYSRASATVRRSD